jgi:hypothetical protein
VRVTSLLLSLFVSAGAPEPADVPHLRVVRSLAAEAALYIRLERTHQVSATYAAEMRKLTRQNLLSERRDARSGEVNRFAGLALQALAAGDDRALGDVSSRLSELLGT